MPHLAGLIKSHPATQTGAVHQPAHAQSCTGQEHVAKHSARRQSKQTFQIARVAEREWKGTRTPPTGQSRSGETFAVALGLVLTATHFKIGLKKRFSFLFSSRSWKLLLRLKHQLCRALTMSLSAESIAALPSPAELCETEISQ